MRVLSINDYSPPSGGAEIIWRQTHELLLESGVDSKLFAADEVVERRMPWSYLYSTRVAAALRAEVTAWRPDIVHLHNFYHLCSPSILRELANARRRGDVRRVVATAHDFHLLCPNPGMLQWSRGHEFSVVDPAVQLRPLEKFTVRWDGGGWPRSWLRATQHVLAYDLLQLRQVFDRVLCPSQFLANALSSVVDTYVLPNPAPEPVTVRKDNSKLMALCAGRITAEKGLTAFLEMAPKPFLDCLLVAGHGKDKARAREVVRRRGLATRFVGHLSHDEVLELLAQTHVVVLPSRWYENAPTILFEGLSRGANLLASDLGGIREIVNESRTGFLFDPWNRSSIETATGRVCDAFASGELNSFDVSDFLGARSRSSYISALLACYEEVLGR
jgi:glycosyltransferase involved in cell wall biosynthesis